MHRHIRLAAALMGLILALGIARPCAADAKSTVEEIRKELMQLPYYGVFDYLAFSYDKGTVTLGGFAYHPGLKRDAVRAVKRVAGVDQVIDKIEELPVSQNDDELRWKAYYAIYRDSSVPLRAWRGDAVGTPPSIRTRIPRLRARDVSGHGARRRLPDSHHREERAHHAARRGG
jgi:hypothetical protein